MEDEFGTREELSNVLDALRDSASALNRTLNSADSSKLDQYLTSVRDVERRLQMSKEWLDRPKPKSPIAEVQDEERQHIDEVALFYDLMALALQTDSTRIITLSLDWVYGAIRVPGAAGGWHTLSHHGGKESLIHPLSRIEADILRHFNRFLVEMDQVEETDGSLLDHTTVVFGSNFEDASNHSNDKPA